MVGQLDQESGSFLTAQGHFREIKKIKNTENHLTKTEQLVG